MLDSCVSEDTLPALQDAHNDCGEDRFSPGISDCTEMNCHVDLDSLWMIHWEDRRTVETGSHAGVSAWRSVLCGIARMSCLPEFPVNNGLKCLKYLERNCIMDISAGGTLSPSESDPTGLDGPYVPGGPVGHIGTLAPSISTSEILVDHGGTLPSSDLTGMLIPSIPVGPVGLWGTLPPSDSALTGLDGP